MTQNTRSVVDVADKIIEIFTANLVPLGVKAEDLYYGDQVKIPRTKAICVDPQQEDNEFAGVGGGGRLKVIHEVHIILYFARLRDSEGLRKEADLFAQQVKDLLHTPGQGLMASQIDATPTVLAGNVVRLNNGQATRQGDKFRASRLIYQGMCKTSIVP